MAIQLRCPGCKQVLAIDDKFAGQTLRCPKCQQMFRAPGVAPAAPAPPVSLQPRPAAAPGQKSGSWLRWCVVALLCIAGGAGGYLWWSGFFSGDGDDGLPDGAEQAAGKSFSLAGKVECVAFSADGAWLAAGGVEPKAGVKIWDVKTGKELFAGWDEDSIRAVAFSDKYFAAAGWNKDGGLVKLRTLDGAETFTLKAKGAQLQALALAPDGATLVTGDNAGAVTFWDVANRQVIKEISEHEGAVKAVAFARDGKTAASGGDDGLVRVWDVTNQEVLANLRADAKVTGLAFEPPEGLTLAVACNTDLQFWDWKDVQKFGFLELPADAPFRCAAYSADGKRIATGHGDDLARLWDVETQKELKAFPGHTGPIWGIAFAPDGSRIATASWDKSVRLWQLK